jgi:amino acid permease
MLGVAGTIIMKISLIVMLSTLAVVQLLVFGDVLKGLSLLFWDINTKILVVGIALVLLPFMFQKDISGITRYAYFGIIGLGTYYICHVILFIHKWNQNKIIFEKSMLYPNGTFKEIILCVGGYYNAFAFHMSYFTIYLPLRPRNNKTMMKSVTIGTLTTSFIYLSYGILFYLMYGTQISDSALKYLQSDLFEAHKNGETFIVIIFVICFLSFLINASISSMIHFYLFKSHLIGLIRFLIKKKLEKEKEAEEKKAVQMVEIEDNKEGKENNIENRKFSDDVHSIKEKEELLSERKQFLITFVCYVYVLFMAVSFDKIIILDSFNGSTVANYINIIAPSIFYFYFARGKKYYGEKLIALFNLLFGVALILLFFILSFY